MTLETHGLVYFFLRNRSIFSVLKETIKDVPSWIVRRLLKQNEETSFCGIDSVDGNRKLAKGSCDSPELVETNAERGRGRRKGALALSRGYRGGSKGGEVRGGNARVVRYDALKLFHFNNYEPELNTAWSDCEFARFAVLIAIDYLHK